MITNGVKFDIKKMYVLISLLNDCCYLTSLLDVSAYTIRKS